MQLERTARKKRNDEMEEEEEEAEGEELAAAAAAVKSLSVRPSVRPSTARASLVHGRGVAS